MQSVLEEKIVKTIDQVQASAAAPAAECVINDAPRTFTDADFEVGVAAHQGDLILLRIAKLPASAKPRASRQLAIGSTQGSRHILEIGNAFDCDADDVIAAIQEVVPKCVLTAPFIGPVFQTVHGEAALTHPEHGDFHFEGDMTVACVYQRNLDQEERERRTQD